MVLLMYSRISAVFRGRSPKNFLIFSRMRVVFMVGPSCHFRCGFIGNVPLKLRSEAADIMLPPRFDDLVTVSASIAVYFQHFGAIM